MSSSGGPRIDHDRQPVGCCLNMRNEVKNCTLVINSKTGGVEVYDLDGDYYVTDQPLKYCPWCGLRIKLEFKKDPPIDESKRKEEVSRIIPPMPEQEDLFNAPPSEKLMRMRKDCCNNCYHYHVTAVDRDPVVFVCNCLCHKS